MKVTVVTTTQLCSACHIVEQAVRETVARLQRQMEGLEVDWVVLDTAEEAARYPGVELPAFPALFFAGEQVTAGTIPTVAELRAWLAEGETP